MKGSPKETNCWELRCSETNPNGPLSVRVLKKKKTKKKISAKPCFQEANLFRTQPNDNSAKNYKRPIL